MNEECAECKFRRNKLLDNEYTLAPEILDSLRVLSEEEYINMRIKYAKLDLQFWQMKIKDYEKKKEEREKNE